MVDSLRTPSRSPIVLLGATGMLGRAVLSQLEAQGLRPEMPPRSELCLSDAASVQQAVPRTAKLVVNCAAFTDVDAAETHENEATETNGLVVELLGHRCRQVGATLIHFSTDYVFSGEQSAAYQPSAKRKPLNAYGRSKALGEELLETSGCEHLLLRTSWLYAPWGRNFVRTIWELAGSREQLRVVNDQRGRPTSAQHLARAALELYRLGRKGTLHVTDGGECSWFDLARFVAAHRNPNCLVVPCSSEEYPRPAPRPSFSVLALGATERELGKMPHWEDNVLEVLRRLETAHLE